MAALKLRSVDNSRLIACRVGRLLLDPTLCGLGEHQQAGAFMAKRKKQSKAKLQRANSAKRSKARKVAKTAKRAAARAKPKPAPAKKVARKVKQPAAPVVET